MPKQKVSATISPERLRQAQALTGNGNVSEVLDQALEVLIERELERRWLEGRGEAAADDLPGEVPVDLSDVPWEGEPSR